MKSAVKLPLYLGFAVFILSVIISAVKIGNQQVFNSDKSQAKAAGAKLVLKYTPPNLVSVIVTSQSIINGADIVLKFNSDKISILPSTLSGGPSFITSGGSVDQQAGTFSFSAIAKKSPATSEVVASFIVNSAGSFKSVDADIQFSGVGLTTTVIEKISGQNILNQVEGVKFKLSAK